MLSMDQAVDIAKKNSLGGTIKKVVAYKNLYVFQIFWLDDEEEGEMDPFRSVHKETGKFEEFSILTDSEDFDIVPLLQAAPSLDIAS